MLDNSSIKFAWLSPNHPLFFMMLNSAFIITVLCTFSFPWQTLFYKYDGALHLWSVNKAAALRNICKKVVKNFGKGAAHRNIIAKSC
jgi:hypothetical protein